MLTTTRTTSLCATIQCCGMNRPTRTPPLPLLPEESASAASPSASRDPLHSFPNGILKIASLIPHNSSSHSSSSSNNKGISLQWKKKKRLLLHSLLRLFRNKNPNMEIDLHILERVHHIRTVRHVQTARRSIRVPQRRPL